MTRKEKEFIRHAERNDLGHIGCRVHSQQGQNALFRAGSLGNLPTPGRQGGRRIEERSHLLVSAASWYTFWASSRMFAGFSVAFRWMCMAFNRP